MPEKSLERLSPLTGKPSKFLFSAKVLGKYDALYYFDPVAQYIFADEPVWLEEAYSEAIAQTDTGVLARNLRNADILCRLFRSFSQFQGPFLDLGGGYGIFVRRMRDHGYDFYWHDRYAENLLARGFEAAPGDYQLAVAFEVLEHLPNPLRFVIDMQEQYRFRSLIFSATCFDPQDIPQKDWWYWAFESGQHISFFSLESLRWIGKQLDMRLTPLTADLFMLSGEIEGDLSAACRRSLFERVCNRLTAYAIPGPRNVRSSLTFCDHLEVRQRLQRLAGTTPET